MFRTIVILLFVFSALHASFTTYIYKPCFALDYRSLSHVEIGGKYYQEVEGLFYYPNIVALAVVTPVALAMDAGVATHEMIYSKLLSEQLRPIAAAGILSDIAEGKKPSDEKIALLNVKIEFDTKFDDYPYMPHLELSKREHGGKVLQVGNGVGDMDLIKAREKFYKYDVLHQDGVNYFILFSKDKSKYLTINGYEMPFTVFCELDGAFYQFALDFKNKKADILLFGENFFQYEKKVHSFDNRYEEEKYKRFITRPKAVIEKNFKLFVKAYSDYMRTLQ